MKIHGQNKGRTCTSWKASCFFHVNFYHPDVGKKVVEVFFSGIVQSNKIAMDQNEERLLQQYELKRLNAQRNF